MDYEANRILEISLAKIDRAKTSRKQLNATNTLRRNLLVSSVLKAIKTDSLPGQDVLMDYRESKIIDLDFDEANFEVKGKETDFVRSHSTVQRLSPSQSIEHEWKPRASSECCDWDMKENFDSGLAGTKEKYADELCTDCLKDRDSSPKCLGQDCGRSLEALNNTPDLRKSLAFKRPRDSDFDMSHMPRPNKICKVIRTDESCDFDTQAVSCLETMFRDGFNELVEANSYELPINFATFSLVSVMAC